MDRLVARAKAGQSQVLVLRGEAGVGKAEAEDLYREAIERLDRTRISVHLARTRLIYGERLRRNQRRADAREQLRIAFEALSRFGAEAFAERARREPRATGDTARKRTVEPRIALTAQEERIARLASNGLTNPEIGAQLSWLAGLIRPISGVGH